MIQAKRNLRMRQFSTFATGVWIGFLGLSCEGNVGHYSSADAAGEDFIQECMQAEDCEGKAFPKSCKNGVWSCVQGRCESSCERTDGGGNPDESECLSDTFMPPSDENCSCECQDCDCKKIQCSCDAQCYGEDCLIGVDQDGNATSDDPFLQNCDIACSEEDDISKTMECSVTNCEFPEVCNGKDDNGDGRVDEGFPDDDYDGIVNCMDAPEVCNGRDDDGNGKIDEGFPDTDGDGVADCVDEEEPCPTCNDCWDMDGDGYGNYGKDCLGPDCNDNDPNCHNGECCCQDYDHDGYGYDLGVTKTCLGPDCNDGDADCWEGSCCCIDTDKDGHGQSMDYSAQDCPKDCNDWDPDCWEGDCCCHDFDGDGYAADAMTAKYYGASCLQDCDDSDETCWEGKCCCTDMDGDGYAQDDQWAWSEQCPVDCNDTDPDCWEGDCCPTICYDNDKDGYGWGEDCLGLDCDDNNASCWTGDCCRPDCIDMDGDGYGEGAGCLGPDCNDHNPNAHG